MTITDDEVLADLTEEERRQWCGQDFAVDILLRAIATERRARKEAEALVVSQDVAWAALETVDDIRAERDAAVRAAEIANETRNTALQKAEDCITRAEKAEAEVARLQGVVNIRDAEIAEMMVDLKKVSADFDRVDDEVARLQGVVNIRVAEIASELLQENERLRAESKKASPLLREAHDREQAFLRSIAGEDQDL